MVQQGLKGFDHNIKTFGKKNVLEDQSLIRMVRSLGCTQP
jgi:hypothetical protein